MTDDPTRNRRTGDRQMAEFSTRLVLVERDVKQILESLPPIRDRLDGLRDFMSDPQASPQGRQLLSRADINKARLDEHERRIDMLADWKSEMIGAYKFSRLVQTVLAIALALLTLVQVGLATGRLP